MKFVEVKLFSGQKPTVAERRWKLARHIVPGLWVKIIFVLKGLRTCDQYFPSSRRDEISLWCLPGTMSPANFQCSAGAKKTTSL